MSKSTKKILRQKIIRKHPQFSEILVAKKTNRDFAIIQQSLIHIRESVTINTNSLNSLPIQNSQDKTIKEIFKQLNVQIPKIITNIDDIQKTIQVIQNIITAFTQLPHESNLPV